MMVGPALQTHAHDMHTFSSSRENIGVKRFIKFIPPDPVLGAHTHTHTQTHTHTNKHTNVRTHTPTHTQNIRGLCAAVCLSGRHLKNEDPQS